MFETTVLGMGNILLMDEGVGVWGLRRLMTHPRLPEDVRLVDGGTLGLELLSTLAGTRRLLVLDAVEAGLEPGTVVRIDGADLATLPGGGTVHQLGLADVLSALRLVEQEPEEVVLLGVQPDEIKLGTWLSPRVEAALERLVEAAVDQLEKWSAEVECPAPT